MKGFAILSLVIATFLLGAWRGATMALADSQLIVTASFSEKSVVRPDEQIELTLSRSLQGSEERVAVLIGTTDVSSLFTQDKLRFRYSPKLWPLPAGDSTVIV